MMSTQLILTAISAAFLILGIILLVRPLRAEANSRAQKTKNIEELSARHFRRLQHLRNVLTGQDNAFIDQRLSPGSAARVRSERKDAVRKYLAGILQDFAAVDRLAREVASLSPNVEHRLESERLFLEIRFRILYRLALLRLSAGGQLPFEAVARLTEIVGALSRQVDAMMVPLQTLAPAQPTRHPSHS
jgi:hypothetical protein